MKIAKKVEWFYTCELAVYADTSTLLISAERVGLWMRSFLQGPLSWYGLFCWTFLHLHPPLLRYKIINISIIPGDSHWNVIQILSNQIWAANEFPWPFRCVSCSHCGSLCTTNTEQSFYKLQYSMASVYFFFCWCDVLVTHLGKKRPWEMTRNSNCRAWEFQKNRTHCCPAWITW